MLKTIYRIPVMHIQKYPTPWSSHSYWLYLYIYIHILVIFPMIIGWSFLQYIYIFFSRCYVILVLYLNTPMTVGFYPSFHTFSPAVLSFRNRLLLIDISEPIRVRGKVCANNRWVLWTFWTGWFFLFGVSDYSISGYPIFRHIHLWLIKG